MPAAVFDSAEDLLAGRGALEIEHPGGTLLAHLRRVRELLAEWGASADTQLAGLCHAAYGTDGFAVALFELDERVVLREVIGEAAESIVYCYGSCARKPSYAQLGTRSPIFTDRFSGENYLLDSEQLQAFLEITAANELDVFRHNVELADRYAEGMRAVLARAVDQLSLPARAAWSLD